MWIIKMSYDLPSYGFVKPQGGDIYLELYDFISVYQTS